MSSSANDDFLDELSKIRKQARERKKSLKSNIKNLQLKPIRPGNGATYSNRK
jgi:hypothetical protein